MEVSGCAHRHSITRSLPTTAQSGVANDIGPAGASSLNADYSLIKAPGGQPIVGVGNLIGVDPLLAPLADNGGPTEDASALRGGSPAANTGDPAAVAGVGGVPTFDQRGGPVHRGSSADALISGHTRRRSAVLSWTRSVDEADGDFSEGDLSLREAIEIANTTTRKDTIELRRR